MCVFPNSICSNKPSSPIQGLFKTYFTTMQIQKEKLHYHLLTFSDDLSAKETEQFFFFKYIKLGSHSSLRLT